SVGSQSYTTAMSTSLTSGISATPKLQQFLDESRDGQHRDVSVLRVQVRGENLVETARKNGPANGDLSQIEEYLEDIPAFILLRATTSTWYVITWMPEGKVGVHSSMVYASTQSNLKMAVGDCIEDSLQFGSVDEAFGRDPPAAQPSTATTPTTRVAPVEPVASKAVIPPAPAPKPAGLEPKHYSSPISPSTTCIQKQQDSEQTGSYVAESTRVISATRTVTTTTTTTRTTAASAPVASVMTAAPGSYAAQTEPSAQRGGVFVKKMDPRLAMSKSELEHMNVLSEEDSARSEQLEQMRSRLRSHASPAQPSVSPSSNDSNSNHHTNTAGLKQTVAAASGGFHTVTLPLSPQAKDALSEFLSNVGITVVELQVEANKRVTSARSFTSTEEFVPNPSEPRFYIMRTPGSRAFVYSCPESSQPRLRMAYSTTGASTLAQIQSLGCRITHRLSLFMPNECTLIAVAATIRNGQAQRVDSEKPVDDVINYVPNAPARSLPSRFAVNTTKTLDGFTDEQGFRKAFSNVRPDAPVPVPFKAGGISKRSTFIRTSVTNDDNDNVDTSPNTGAAAWGVQLRSGLRKSVSSSPAISHTNVDML
ncbi:Twinfilin-1, partial [Coemansia sp. RSA 986]